MRFAKKWNELLQDELQKPYMTKLSKFLNKEYVQETIYPPREDIFRAYLLTDYNNVKVCIVGQDPYHGEGQANGLAFAIKDGNRVPPSLRNIFSEIQTIYGEVPESTSLEGWARQGVFLLNSTLTVKAGEPGSHQGQGWETFTDKTISLLSDREEPVIFVLWGASARSKKKLIAGHHIILEAAHPSPLSAYRGFFGCKHFELANQKLDNKINWIKSK